MPLGILAPRAPRTSATAAWWPVVLPLALMLSSDYKLRARPVDQAIGGSADLTVLLEIGVYGLVAAYAYYRFGLRPPVRRTTGLLFAAWAFAVYVALSALWSPFPSLGVVRGSQLLVTMVVAQLLATRATLAEIHRLAHAFIVVVVISVGIGIVHPFPRTPLAAERFNWLYVHPVSAAVYLAVGVLLTVGFLIRAERAHRIWHPSLYLGALVVQTGALIATGTRGAALGCAIGLGVLLATARGPRGRADAMVLGAALLALSTLAFSEQILEFAARGDSAEKISSLNSRTDLWVLAFDLFGREPLFGWGLGASRGLFLKDLGLGGAHNAFVNALVDNGAVGAAVFASLLATLIFVLSRMAPRRSLRPDAGMLLGILTFFLVDSITIEGLATPANVSGIWLLLLVAWAENLRRGTRLGLGTPVTRAPVTEVTEVTRVPGAAVHHQAEDDQRDDRHQ